MRCFRVAHRYREIILRDLFCTLFTACQISATVSIRPNSSWVRMLFSTSKDQLPPGGLAKNRLWYQKLRQTECHLSGEFTIVIDQCTELLR